MGIDILREHTQELSALAAECGIDWPATADQIRGPGKYERPAVLHRKYRNRCVIFMTEFETRSGEKCCRLTFSTQKHGGINRTWTSRPKRRGANLRSISVSRPSSAGDDRARRQELFGIFKSAFDGAPQADAAHPYLVQKSIGAITALTDVRVLTDQRVFGHGTSSPYLCVPIRSPRGDFVGFQRIYHRAEGGNKKLTPTLWDGQYRGAFATLGDPDAARTIYIAEGFATGASIHVATGAAVLIAISAQNLDRVAGHARQTWHGKQIIIVADNDRPASGEEHKGNPGIFRALEAAKNNRTSFVTIPLIGGRKADANDIHCAFGLERLQEILLSEKAKPEAAEAHLLALMKFARTDALKKLVGEYLTRGKVGYGITVRHAARMVSAATGGRYSEAEFEKRARGFLWRKSRRVQALVTIKGADIYSTHYTVPDENGHEVIPQSALDEILEHRAKKRMVILRGPPGVGKTERVIKGLMDRSDRAALFLPRVAVVYDAASRLSLVNYNDLDPLTAKFVDKVAVCINSANAPKFNDNGHNFFEHLDTLCLDECAQGFGQMVSLGSYKQRTGNTGAMIKAISSAKFVLAADAFANQYTLECLKSMDNGRDIVVMDIKFADPMTFGRDIEIASQPTEVIADALHSVSRGVPTIFATDSVKTARRFQQQALKYLEPEEMLTICREQTVEEKKATMEFTADPNAHARKYKLLIYTPKVDSGLSITVPHFKGHFAVFQGVVGVQTMAQMLGRDRTSKRWLLSLRDNSVRMKQLAREADEQFNAGASVYGKIRLMSADFEIQSREDFHASAIDFLRLLGHRVEFRPPQDPDRKLADALTQAGERLAEEKIARILQAPVISEERYEYLKTEPMPTHEDAAAVIAHEVREHLCAELDRTNVLFHARSGIRSVWNAETMVSSAEACREFDNSKVQKLMEPMERFKAIDRREVIHKALEILGVDRMDFHGEFRSENAEDFRAWAVSDAQRLNHLFRGIIDPLRPPRGAVQFLQKFLGLYGIALGKRKSNGRMIRFVDQQSVNRIMEFIEARREHGRELIPQLYAEVHQAAGTPP